MNNVIKMLKGILIGVGAILPGVSGGMIAAAFNIYDKLIAALDELTRRPIKAILSIWQYLVGIVIGILIGFLVVAYIFNFVPIPATLLFIGLILGGLPEIFFAAYHNHVSIKGIVVTSITFVIMLTLSMINVQTETTMNTSWYVWLLIGVLLTVSLVVPGLSGTMLLLMIGFYVPMLNLGRDFIGAVIAFDIQTIGVLLPQAIFVAIGVIVTFIILGKLLNLVLKKYPNLFFQIVLGIILSSPINIMISLRNELILDDIDIFDFQTQWWMWLIGIVLLPSGIYTARLFSKEKNETETNQGSNV